MKNSFTSVSLNTTHGLMFPCSVSEGVGVYLQGVPPLLGEGTQVVPLVTDALAAGVDCGSIVVVQLTGGDNRVKHSAINYHKFPLQN